MVLRISYCLGVGSLTPVCWISFRFGCGTLASPRIFVSSSVARLSDRPNTAAPWRRLSALRGRTLHTTHSAAIACFAPYVVVWSCGVSEHVQSWAQASYVKSWPACCPPPWFTTHGLPPQDHHTRFSTTRSTMTRIKSLLGSFRASPVQSKYM